MNMKNYHYIIWTSVERCYELIYMNSKFNLHVLEYESVLNLKMQQRSVGNTMYLLLFTVLKERSLRFFKFYIEKQNQKIKFLLK